MDDETKLGCGAFFLGAILGFFLVVIVVIPNYRDTWRQEAVNRNYGEWSVKDGYVSWKWIDPPNFKQSK